MDETLLFKPFGLEALLRAIEGSGDSRVAQDWQPDEARPD